MKYNEFLERTSFSKLELISCSRKSLVEDPPEGGIAPLPAPPFLMFDRVTHIDRKSKGGRIIAEQDIAFDSWYFQCHFASDPVQPGCLGVDAIWQLLGFYCVASGAAGSGRALGSGAIDFQGQIRPFNKMVTYEVDIRRLTFLKDSGNCLVIGNGLVSVDGQRIYTIENARVGVFKGIDYPDYPNPESPNAIGGILGNHDN